MAFHYASSELNIEGVGYPADTPERFSAALLQFVWSSERRLEEEAEWSLAESHAAHASTAMEKRDASMPLPSSHAAQILQALRDLLDSARPCPSCPRADSVTEAGVFLMRLTRLFEQKTLAKVQEEVNLSSLAATTPTSVSPPAPISTACLGDCNALRSDKRSASHGSGTLHSRGRRYTVPEASFSYSPSSSSVLDVSALRDPKTEDIWGITPARMWRFHAILTLQLQQSMLRCMCLLDAALANFSADDGGLCGVLTHPRALQLQEMFIDAIATTLSSAEQRWAADTTTADSTETLREVSVVLERLQQAAHAQHHTGKAPQLHVYELSTAEPSRCSPPPFASWRRSSFSFLSHSRNDDTDLEAACAPSAPGNCVDIERCLGVAGSDYVTKLVAQHLWCAQKLLSQRFPSYAPSWDLLERARFFVESTRSPTPTVPRSDSNEHVGNFSVPATMQSASVAPSPERGPRHDGETPPPCVTATQRKSERPVDVVNLTLSPLRSLTYSEKRPEGASGPEGGAAETLLSSSLRLTASPPAVLHHGATVPHLLPVARCVLWENLLASCGVSAGSAVAAIQQLTGEKDPLQLRALSPQRRERPGETDRARSLQTVPVNQPLVKQPMGERTKMTSIETEYGAENHQHPLLSKRLFAQST
jgi:hypothetical protein